MAEWKRTFCILCYVNCGLEVATDGSRPQTSRASSPRSCSKLPVRLARNSDTQPAASRSA
jgi:hypothetical protein